MADYHAPAEGPMRMGRMMGQGPSVAGGRRGTEGAGLGPAAREAIAAAHALERDGRAAEAALRFAELSARAGTRGMPGVALHLALEGARNRAKTGAVDAAVADAVAAMTHAAALANRAKVAHRFGALTEGLRANGMPEAADRIEAELRSRLGTTARAATAAVVNRSQRRHLPRSCGTCSAPVDTERVRFEDDGTADCAYCGVNLLG